MTRELLHAILESRLGFGDGVVIEMRDALPQMFTLSDPVTDESTDESIYFVDVSRDGSVETTSGLPHG